ncbi:uncharacterized protein LOC129303350 isoform X1 [Prosopis cineraria]|uniref:uncharacterized protein LOC129303350 isoform X1 n=1 Tax=Prosopis cineraria TaxID=364024 RepID=UPI00240F4B03|nr:uncharacterized protein LOC129303350 isoform X1 [Prosopis cineraria]
MSKIPLIIDAWMREAQEASHWLEDLESRIKHKGLVHSTSLHSARSKLLELGVKLDRLESLLRNLPAKPILTDEDVEYRWKMLKDIQLRTKSLVSSVSAVPSPDWPRDVLATADTEECNVGPDYCDQDQTKTSYQDNIELLKPLLQDAGSRSEGQVSSSSMSMYWVWKACSAILLFLALAALIFFLALLCTAF